MRRLIVEVGLLFAVLLLGAASPALAQVSSRNAIGAPGAGGQPAAPVDIEALKQRAASGDVAAESELGNRYLWGQAVGRDTAQAFDWLSKAAIAGDCGAQLDLGLMFWAALGVKEDYNSSAHWYQKAAEQGSVAGEFSMGNLYMRGEGVDQDDEKAVFWLSKAVEQKSSGAMAKLGLMAMQGRGGPKDERNAVEWFRKAAAAGDAEGASLMAQAYEKGVGGLPKDQDEASVWYETAAKRGFADAIHEIAIRYRDGKGVTRNLTTARQWFEKSVAVANNADSALNLGDMYSMGITVAPDFTQAAAYYKKAADAGNARAQFAYGFLLEHGQGVPRDDAMAARYYDAAAKQNSVPAQNNLGMMYAQGRGVERDDGRALTLFQAAAAGGDASAAKNAAQMAAIVAQNRQLQEAQQQAQLAQQEAASANQEQEDRQERIAQLQDEIENLNEEAERWDDTVQQTSTNTCTGIAAALCNGIGAFGAAKARQNAAEARSKAQADLEEIQRLAGMRVQHVNIDTSYGAALQQQVAQNPLPSIQATLAQQQANLFAAANLHQQAASAQLASAQLAAANQQRAAAAALQQSSAGNPYSAGGSYVPVANNTGPAPASYVSGLGNCIGTFWDPKEFTALRLQNNCNQAVHVRVVMPARTGDGLFDFDFVPGANTGTIGFQDDQDKLHANGMQLYVCPFNYAAVDGNDNQILGVVGSFRCKKQS